MTLPFTNTTELRDYGNSDLDVITKHNEQKREKDNIRNTVTVITIVVLTLVIDLLLFTVGLTLTYKGIILSGIICAFPGYALSNFIINVKFGKEQPQMSKPNSINYTFNDSGIKAVNGISVDYIMYSDITSVTEDPYYFYMFVGQKKHHVSKTGFSTSAADFEELMLSKGITVQR